MFKERFIKSVAYIVFIAAILLVCCIITVSIAVIKALLIIYPIADAVVKVILTLAALLILGALIIEFINWLIVEPYRNHKRIQANAKRETEGPVE